MNDNHIEDIKSCPYLLNIRCKCSFDEDNFLTVQILIVDIFCKFDKQTIHKFFGKQRRISKDHTHFLQVNLIVFVKIILAETRNNKLIDFRIFVKFLNFAIAIDNDIMFLT